MIKLGVSACFMGPDPSRKVFGPKTLFYTEADMMRFLCGKNSMPILIPNVSDELLDAYLDEVDGIVLQGGADIAPESYGEKPIDPKNWPGDRKRDLYELKIMERAHQASIPVLGICRGMQLINIFYGGTLYQDLKYQGRINHTHRDAEKYDTLHHKVDLMPGSILQRAYRAECIEVNTVHHQGIKTLGTDLVCEARSGSENLIEGLRHKNLPHWGVQWHPEFNPTLKGIVASETPILKAFIQMIRANKEQYERHKPSDRRTYKRDQIRR